MGCDIHICIEKRVNNQWMMINRLGFRDYGCYRNYKRFAALASVRGNGLTPKGLPDDISESAKLYSEEFGSDGHSHSCLPLMEASKIFLNTEDERNKKIDTPESHYFDIDLDCAPGEYRIVFWFDNKKGE